ncbi:MAG: hypothetical protein ACK4WC_16900 [Rubrimonas sp.]
MTLPSAPRVAPFTVDAPSGVRTVSLIPGAAIAPEVAARVLAVRCGQTAGWVSFTYHDDTVENDVYLAAGDTWPVKLVKAVRQPSDPADSTPPAPLVYLFLG